MFIIDLLKPLFESRRLGGRDSGAKGGEGGEGKGQAHIDRYRDMRISGLQKALHAAAAPYQDTAAQRTHVQAAAAPFQDTAAQQLHSIHKQVGGHP